VARLTFTTSRTDVFPLNLDKKGIKKNKIRLDLRFSEKQHSMHAMLGAREVNGQ
jgi:hypothetical protein